MDKSEKMKSYIGSEDDKVYNTPEKWFVRERWANFALIRRDKNKIKFIRLLTLTSIKAYDIKFLFKKQDWRNCKDRQFRGYNNQSTSLK